MLFGSELGIYIPWAMLPLYPKNIALSGIKAFCSCPLPIPALEIAGGNVVQRRGAALDLRVTLANLGRAQSHDKRGQNFLRGVKENLGYIELADKYSFDTSRLLY